MYAYREVYKRSSETSKAGKGYGRLQENTGPGGACNRKTDHTSAAKGTRRDFHAHGPKHSMKCSVAHLKEGIKETS